MDLNMDCQLAILEQLDFDTLRNVAQTNQHFAELATYIFKQLISSTKFSIHGTRNTNTSLDASDLIARDLQHVWFENLSSYFIRFENDSFHSRNLGAILNVLKYFGDSIKKLAIFTAFVPDGGIHKSVGQMINEHCSETLVELEVLHFYADVFKYFTKPFRAVESVAFGHVINVDERDYLPMSQLFPNLKRLVLILDQMLNSSYIVRHLPHLNYLMIKDKSYQSSVDGDAAGLEKLIKLNPQIRNINFESVESPRVKFVSEHLPDLDSLSLAGVDGGNQIHFRNVTKFVMRGIPSFIRFDYLQEVHAICLTECNRWIDFMQKHPMVEVLSVSVPELDAETFTIFTTHIPNVRVLTIKSQSEECHWIKPENLINFLNKHNNLQRFSIFGLELTTNQSIFERLHEKLHMKWFIKRNGPQFCFERK